MTRKHKLEDAVDGVAVKKIKKDDGEDAKIQEEIKKQNKIMYKYKDLVEKELSRGQIQALLEYNKQQVPSGNSNVMPQLIFSFEMKCFIFSSSTGIGPFM